VARRKKKERSLACMKDESFPFDRPTFSLVSFCGACGERWRFKAVDVDRWHDRSKTVEMVREGGPSAKGRLSHIRDERTPTLWHSLGVGPAQSRVYRRVYRAATTVKPCS